MENVALAIHSEKIKQEIFDFLKKFPSNEVEILPIEDAEDLQILQKTRNEETVSFSAYLSNADWVKKVRSEWPKTAAKIYQRSHKF